MAMVIPRFRLKRARIEDIIRFDIAGSEKVLINSSGIGIGENGANDLIHITEANAATSVHFRAEQSNVSSIAKFGVQGNGSGIIGTFTNHPFQFKTNDTVRMNIEEDGKVGIGTTNPNEKLTLEGVFSLREQAAAPSGTASYGKLYTKTDGKLYFLDNAGTETDLLAGGSGGTSAIANGGTGATTAGGARTNLGLEIDTNVQAFDAQLVDLAGLSPTANNFIMGDGSNFVLADGASARTALGVDIGSDVQGFNDRLADIAGMSGTLNNVIIGDGSNFVLATPAGARSALGLALGTDIQAFSDRLTDISAVGVTADNFLMGNGSNLVLRTPSTARTSLGLGSIATQDVDSLELSGVAGSSVLTLTDTDNSGSVNLMTGAGSPEGVFSAQVGSLYSDHANGKLYKKSSGDGTNTGWEEVTTQSSGDSLSDSDGDTNILLEESADEDKIKFKTNGTQRMVIDTTGNVGIGSATPAVSLDIAGAMRMTKNGTEPFTCDASKDAAIAVTALYTTCICKNGTGWVKTVDGTTTCSWNEINIVVNGSGKKFADGTFATTCNGYRNPTAPYIYSGTTGDGQYTIDPDGAGGNAEFDVECDMTFDGGGWTLVANRDTLANIEGAAAIGSSGDATYKLSTTVIDSIMASSSYWLFLGHISNKRVKLKTTNTDADAYDDLKNVLVGNGVSGCGSDSFDGVNRIDVDSAGTVCWAYPTNANTWFDAHSTASGGNGVGSTVWLK
jgi:hypothetical protein